MAELIDCRECTSPYCRGCNIYILFRALRDRKFDGLMNENRLIVVPKNVAPVRHGRWIKKKGSLWSLANCSICGKLTVEGDALYCPNCGAKMGETE